MATLHLLVSLATHFRAPIRLPERVSVQVVVVRVSVPERVRGQRAHVSAAEAPGSSPPPPRCTLPALFISISIFFFFFFLFFPLPQATTSYFPS